MIDWKRKLTSRKFWAAVINFVTQLLIAFNVAEDAIVQVTALILAAAGLVAYIIAEGFIDAAATDPDGNIEVDLVGIENLTQEEIEDLVDGIRDLL